MFSISSSKQATFEDGLLEEAKAKRHSLMSEAIDIGRKAGAYRTILTHFSQVHLTTLTIGVPCFQFEAHLYYHRGYCSMPCKLNMLHLARDKSRQSKYKTPVSPALCLDYTRDLHFQIVPASEGRLVRCAALCKDPGDWGVL